MIMSNLEILLNLIEVYLAYNDLSLTEETRDLAVRLFLETQV
jgi:hypothetical protein